MPGPTTDTRARVCKLAERARYKLPSGAPNKSKIARAVGVSRRRVQAILAEWIKARTDGQVRGEIETMQQPQTAVEVELNNGKREHKGLIVATMLTLESIFDKDPLLAYDLVMLARDATYKMFGNAQERARRYALLEQDGRMHESIRNIIGAAVQGEGLQMTLGNPIK